MSLIRRCSVAAFLAAATLAGASDSHAETREIKAGTLAPKSSPWGRVFQAWQEAVAEKSSGDLTLTFFWNGSQGDEPRMIEKMKTGDLDAAATTAVGLSKIWRPILALQMPGLFRTWGALDRARDSIKSETDQAFEAAGFVNLGFGDVGLARFMSRGFGVRMPDDLRGKSPYVGDADLIAPVLYRALGCASATPLSVRGVLPALDAGTLDAINAPALAAVQFQWAPKLTHLTTMVSSVGIGALVMKKSTLDGLPEDKRRLLLDTGHAAAHALTKRIRDADAAAYEKLKGKLEKVDVSEDDEAKWKEVFKKTREQLKQGVFDPALVTRLEGMSG